MAERPGQGIGAGAGAAGQAVKLNIAKPERAKTTAALRPMGMISLMRWQPSRESVEEALYGRPTAGTNPSWPNPQK